MFTLLTFLLLLAIAYYLGAKNGLPKFNWEKNKNNRQDIFDFLSQLQKNDVIKAHNIEDDDSPQYDFTRTYTVVNNDPENHVINLMEYKFKGSTLLTYESKFLKCVLDKNSDVIAKIIERNKEKDERKKENDN